MSERAGPRVLPSSAAGAGEDEVAEIQRARGGDGQALERLVARYLGDVYDVALRVLGERELAEDAAQTALVNALRALDGFRGESSFRTWLLRITVNTARSLARRRRQRREVFLDAAAGVPGGDDVGRAALLRAEAERVRLALERLPPKQRLAVTLRIYQDLSYREIGTVIDCSEGAARVNYHLGIKRLREWLG
ncbi:MAG: sigma-70 family RNA polymerase sigma factor [Gemmatimonadetes bacterium]|nr:sigma-70 family RNA polymerase sigma factor [Gemmatimonadota bacterium]